MRVLLALVCLLSITVAIQARVHRGQPHNETKLHNITDNVVFAPNSGFYGVDVSTLVSESSWSCMRKQHGVHFAVVRAWMATCALDPHAVATLRNAHAAGIANVDVYLFPRFDCHLTAAEQVDHLISGLSGVKFGQIWLDIESGGGWSSDASRNLQWIKDAASRIRTRLGARAVGIYASRNSWSNVCRNLGGGELNEYPIWYAHYDNRPSFSDFSSFAGWHKPAIKQYHGTTSLCGAGVDLNWYA